MKILHLCSSDIKGGAAKAAYRLHTGLRKIGIESFMLVQDKKRDDPYVIGPKTKFEEGIILLRKGLDKLPLFFYPSRKRVPFSTSWLPDNLDRRIKKLNPDIVNIHWINKGFMNVNTLKEINIPTVWTLHDSWPFTGGCHIPHSCRKYEKKCGNCPVLISGKENDLSRKIWLQKKKVYDEVDFAVVAPSIWMKESAQSSSLLKNKKIVRIPNSIDVEAFNVLDKKKTRECLGLSKDKKYILFGAMNATEDRNKGFDLLVSSLEKLQLDNIELLVFGNNKNIKLKVPIPVTYYSFVNDKKFLNKLYSAADITVVPSRSESFSNVTIESLASGTPCVAFSVGGIKDILEHKISGYLAKPYDVEDFAKGIQYCLSRKDMGIQGREKVVREYSLEVQAKRYLELYQSLQ
jgi:glycosyltransferase involved in cell wall biosynthesis